MTLVYILLILIFLAVLYFIYLQKTAKPNEINLNEAISTLVNLNNEQLGKEKEIIKTDLTGKKDAIEKMIKQVEDQLKTVGSQQLTNFSDLRNAVEFTTKTTKELQISTEGLKKTLSSDRMRGAFGEKVAEDLLKQIGFVIGTDYSKQETFEQGRPDYTIYLPDKTKVNIDVKFPYDNVIKMSETDNSDQKTQFLKSFEGDLKRKISEVSSRNYINPEQNTVDFVIVFIPNEMIFSFIYEKFPNILEEAFDKKIVFAGPFSFTAILRMVRQAYENFRFQKNVQGIISQIKIFSAEYSKFSEEFNKFGDKINSLQDQYTKVSQTRNNKLQKIVDRITIEDSSEPKAIV